MLRGCFFLPQNISPLHSSSRLSINILITCIGSHHDQIVGVGTKRVVVYVKLSNKLLKVEIE